MDQPTTPSPEDINTISTFLANSQLPSLTTSPPIDIIVLCASSVLHPASELFRTLISTPSLTRTLILCGGIGHSTPLIYSAIASHPMYHTIHPQIQGLPEAQVLLAILETFFDIEKLRTGGCTILVEDKSTNCGANAVECRKVLEKNDVDVEGKRLVLIQDATMSLRTKAAFDQVFSDLDARPEVLCCPGLIPRVKAVEGELEFDVQGFEKGDLWDMKRFLDLIMGEIPRLELYGPRGMGSIVDVGVPFGVKEAWGRLNGKLGTRR